MFSRKFYLLTTLITSIIIISISMKPRTPLSSTAILIGKMYVDDMRRFDSMLVEYHTHFYDNSYENRVAKYQELAYQFKRTECLLTYLDKKIAYDVFLFPPQFQAREWGPPFPDNWLFVGPFGIDPDSLVLKRTKEEKEFTANFIRRAATNFRKAIEQTRYEIDVRSLDDIMIFEALRLQMARISTLGLGNGDMVIEAAGLPSLKGEFDAWVEMLLIYTPQLSPDRKMSVEKKIREAQELLRAQKDFNGFDRLGFLTTYLIPLSVDLEQIRRELKIHRNLQFTALNPSSDHVYEQNSFNVDFFAPSKEAFLTTAKAELGKFLFFDPILSDNNERACASCHKPELAFTDGFRKSVNFERGDLPRNAPTVINSGFQKVQFWDLRASSLEDQLDSVINSKDELHSSFENVIDRINSSDEYKKLFHAAFPETKRKGIERKHVKIAIACYERELTGLNSRFDKYVRGDKTQLNESEKNGFNVFMGKAKCASCHYPPLFSAPLPPYFEFTDHRAIGVPLRDTMDVYEVDPDTGASKPFQNPFFHFSFKVPTVRNAEITSPYMHNGVYKELTQVIEFYNDAGGVKFSDQMRPGMKGLPFFMILPEKLNLTDQEKKDVIAFMKALTDTTSASNIPKRLPKLTGKYAKLNERKLGGVY